MLGGGVALLRLLVGLNYCHDVSVRRRDPASSPESTRTKHLQQYVVAQPVLLVALVRPLQRLLANRPATDSCSGFLRSCATELLAPTGTPRWPHRSTVGGTSTGSGPGTSRTIFSRALSWRCIEIAPRCSCVAQASDFGPCNAKTAPVDQNLERPEGKIRLRRRSFTNPSRHQACKR